MIPISSLLASASKMKFSKALKSTIAYAKVLLILSLTWINVASIDILISLSAANTTHLGS